MKDGVEALGRICALQTNTRRLGALGMALPALRLRAEEVKEYQEDEKPLELMRALAVGEARERS